MGVNCRIILYNNTVYAGGTLAGRVVYNFDSKESFKAIKLIIRGKALVSYKSGRNTLHSKEKFLQDEIIMYGGEEYSTEMEEGTYTYPFNYVLPIQLPSSFTFYDRYRGTKSHIRYSIKTKRPTQFWTHNDAEEEFSVIKFIDLNFVQPAHDGGEVKLNKDTFWLCCTSRPFYVRLTLDRKGFSPNCKIPFDLECKNQSTYSANNIIVSLRLIATYYNLKPKKLEGRSKIRALKPLTIILSEFSLGPVYSHQSKSWSKNVDVPKFQPIHSYGCKIIDFAYIVYVKVKFSFPHRKLVGLIPIFLGNVPIINRQLPDYAAAMQPLETDQFNFPLIKDLKDLKKNRIQRDILDYV